MPSGPDLYYSLSVYEGNNTAFITAFERSNFPPAIGRFTLVHHVRKSEESSSSSSKLKPEVETVHLHDDEKQKGKGHEIDCSEKPKKLTTTDPTRVFVFYKISGTNGFYCVISSGLSSPPSYPLTWAANFSIPPSSTIGLGTSGPAVEFFQAQDIERLYLLYSTPDYALWQVTYDLSAHTWAGPTSLDTGSSFKPSLIRKQKNFFYVFHHGYNQNNELWYSKIVADPNITTEPNWGPDTHIPGISFDNCPSAVYYGQRIYVFYKNTGNNEIHYIVESIEDSSGEIIWTTPAVLQDAEGNPAITSGPPCATAVQGQLQVYYPGTVAEESDGWQKLWVAQWIDQDPPNNDWVWQIERVYPVSGISQTAPSPLEIVHEVNEPYSSDLFVFHNGVTSGIYDNNQLWYNACIPWSDSPTWLGDLQVTSPTPTPTDSPTAIYSTQLESLVPVFNSSSGSGEPSSVLNK
eukprot:TRINITY_DN2493_c0_g1_i1.p1 TRINITY_DN2493_c0_g1~~TRINITY_DN2493_c0_g1_i1.p1  ORF type:complete len:462 (-),score=60.98 TRINITY_DN2493_c0_g1_i1:62-1447(-)